MALIKLNFGLQITSNCDRVLKELGSPYRVPRVRFLLRTRALCLCVPTRVRSAGACSDVVAWLCKIAPLWVVVRVCALLRVQGPL